MQTRDPIVDFVAKKRIENAWERKENAGDSPKQN
jgi:hypothetical protein